LADDEVDDVEPDGGPGRVQDGVVQGKGSAQEGVVAARQPEHDELPGADRGGDFRTFEANPEGALREGDVLDRAGGAVEAHAGSGEGQSVRSLFSERKSERGQFRSEFLRPPLGMHVWRCEAAWRTACAGKDLRPLSRAPDRRRWRSENAGSGTGHRSRLSPQYRTMQAFELRHPQLPR